VERYDRDRLRAIKDVLADSFVEPFDIRDARQCAYRVLTDILARDELGAPTRVTGKLDHVDAAQAHFALIARLEETYRAMLQQVPKEGAAAVEAMPVDFPKLAQAMSRELRSDVRIEPDKLSPGGYSKVTIFAEMTQDGASTSVVVRVDVGAGVSGTSVLDEYPVLRALFAAGIAVPRPIWAGRLGESKAGVMVV
jgi:hypothetical protein